MKKFVSGLLVAVLMVLTLAIPALAVPVSPHYSCPPCPSCGSETVFYNRVTVSNGDIYVYVICTSCRNVFCSEIIKKSN